MCSATHAAFKNLSTHSKDRQGGAGRAFPILPILCLILSGVLILCTIWPVTVVPSERGETVTKPARKIANPAEVDVRTELVSRIVAHAPTVGENSTAIPGLVLFRRTQATPCYRAAVEPSLTVFVQG